MIIVSSVIFMSKNVTEITQSLEERIAYLEYNLDQLANELLLTRRVVDKQQVQIQYLANKIKGLDCSNIATREEETPPPHY